MGHAQKGGTAVSTGASWVSRATTEAFRVLSGMGSGAAGKQEDMVKVSRYAAAASRQPVRDNTQEHNER